jgi:hypothetical protein
MKIETQMTSKDITHNENFEPSVEVSSCCGVRKAYNLAGRKEDLCSKCGKPFEPQSIPLDRDECECKEGASDMCKACHLPTPNLTPESAEMEEMYKCPSCGKESEHTVTWMKNANGIGGRCFECVQKDNNISSCSPQKEKVCEKNCPDYSGMAILHKEQCDCSCHFSTPNLTPESERIPSPQITEFTEIEEWEKGFWKIMSEYPNDKKTILNQVRTIVERQVYFHSQKIVSEIKSKIEELEKLYLNKNWSYNKALEDVVDLINNIR